MLRGFSNFEQMFRHKMAKVAPTEVLVAKKMKVIIGWEYSLYPKCDFPPHFDQDGHSEEEIAAYRDTFTKFDVDGGGAIDTAELGKLIRVLGCVMRIYFNEKGRFYFPNF